MNNTSPILVKTSQDTKQSRTSPVYVQEKGKLSLQDILNKKPADFNSQIDISWISNALNQKAVEIKYAPWDALYMPKGLWVSSAYGNNTIIVVSADGSICISYDYGATWLEKKITKSLSSIAYGKKLFITVSDNGKCFKSSDNGLSWEEFTIEQDNFSCITYNNDIFIAGTYSGKIYISEDNGKNWKKSCEYNNMQITKIIYNNTNIIIAISSSSNGLAIYSLNDGLTWHKMNMPSSSWISITYGNSKFIACAYDGEIKLAYCQEKDILNNNPTWKNINVSYDETWKDISFGAGVFSLISTTGVILASYDGIRWIKTPCPYGAWNNILRTDYFFMAFSIAEINNDLNAIRSSNGGLTGIMFATINEIINDENVDKAINPVTLKDYLAYRTGKNSSQYPVYSDDLLIECTSTDTLQIKITNINNNSNISDYDKITISGIYIIEKNLANAPIDKNGYLLVQKDSNKIYQFFSNDISFITGYIRQYDNNIWSLWQEKLIKQENIKSIDLSNNNISISENSEFSAIDYILSEENNTIKKISKEDINNNINNIVSNTLNIMAGNNVYWQETADYRIGALILGSDNALYYCIKENGKDNNKNPISSEEYWVKIINNDGKINTDILSVTLGTLALLNNIALADNNLITGILPIEKGGTNTNDGFGWKQTYSSEEFNKKINLTYPFTTQQLVNAIIKLNQPLFCMVYGWSKNNNKITDFPGSSNSHRTIINYVDNNQFYLETIDAFNFTTYICNVNNGVASNWKLSRNSDASIPINMGGTGLTYGALGKPTAAYRLLPEQANGSNYKVGDVIYRYSLGSNAVTQYVPSGGSWLIKTFVYTKGVGTCRMDLGGTYISAGGTKLDTNNLFDFIHILTKIA